MKGSGVHTSMWTMFWGADDAARAISAAKATDIDFIEIAYGLSVWPSVAESAEQVVGQGLPSSQEKRRGTA